MATRLTAFSKFFITLVILGVIGGGGYYMLKKTTWGQNPEKKAEAQKSETGSEETPKTGFKDDENTLVVQLVTWGGYGPGLYFNEGAEPNEQSRFFKEYGFKVRFVVEKIIQQKPGYEYEGAQATIPFTTWGNYSWNDGNLARKDGFYLDCNTDIGSDGLHLTALGEQKIGNLMYTFFSTDESCVLSFFNNITETTEHNNTQNQSFLFSNLIPMGNQELYINPTVEIIDILIFDAQGKLMSSNFQEKLKSISISTFNKGIYLIQAKTKEGLVPRSEKFVIY